MTTTDNIKRAKACGAIVINDGEPNFAPVQILMTDDQLDAYTAQAIKDHAAKVMGAVPWQPIETAPFNRRVIAANDQEMAMVWLDLIDQKFYYAPQGGLVAWKPKHWQNIPHTPGTAPTAQPASPQPLSDEQILKIARRVVEKPADESKPAVEQFAVGIARATEHAHGIGTHKGAA